MTRRTLFVFFILTFGISWGILALFVLFTAQAEAIFGKLGYTNPLFVLCCVRAVTLGRSASSYITTVSLASGLSWGDC